LKKSKVDDEKNENLVFICDSSINGKLIGEAVYAWNQPGWHFLKNFKKIE